MRKKYRNSGIFKHKWFTGIKRKSTILQYKPQSNNMAIILMIVLGVCAFLLIVGLISYGAVESAKGNEAINSGHHVVIMLDLTDSITKNQFNAFIEEVDFVKNNLKVGDIISIYTLTECRKRLFLGIRPKDGTLASSIKANPTMLKKDFIKKFENPLNKSLNNINFQQKANNSRILETIRFIGRSKEFKRADNKKLLIFSNMLQNSTSFSHYTNYNAITDTSSYVLDVEDMLVNTEVSVFILPDKQKLQNGKFHKWWQEYFKLTGVKTIEFKTF